MMVTIFKINNQVIKGNNISKLPSKASKMLIWRNFRKSRGRMFSTVKTWLYGDNNRSSRLKYKSKKRWKLTNRCYKNKKKIWEALRKSDQLQKKDHQIKTKSQFSNPQKLTSTRFSLTIKLHRFSLNLKLKIWKESVSTSKKKLSKGKSSLRNITK